MLRHAANDSPTDHEMRDVLATVESCPHRGPRADCGCNGMRKCAKGKGRNGDVTLNNCIDCVQAGGP